MIIKGIHNLLRLNCIRYSALPLVHKVGSMKRLKNKTKTKQNQQTKNKQTNKQTKTNKTKQNKKQKNNNNKNPFPP